MGGYWCRHKYVHKTRRDNYSQGILGFSETDHQNLLEPRGILKQRDNSYSSGPDLELHNYGVDQRTSGKQSDQGQFPDLLDIPIREKMRNETSVQFNCQCSSAQVGRSSFFFQSFGEGFYPIQYIMLYNYSLQSFILWKFLTVEKVESSFLSSKPWS